MTKDASQRKIYGQGIRGDINQKMGASGFTDINLFIDALITSLDKLTAQNKAMQERITELQPYEDKAISDILNAKVEEK